jgi:ketosteroid isomerase-like protein
MPLPDAARRGTIDRPSRDGPQPNGENYVKILLLALCATFATAAYAADAADPVATVRQFIDSFDKGDVKAAAATHVADVSIIDEVPPYQWQGRDAFKSWLNDLKQRDTALGFTDANVTLGNVIRREVTGDHAYVVMASDYSFKQKGAALHEPSQMTFALRKEKDGWRIVAWTFAGPKATP